MDPLNTDVGDKAVPDTQHMSVRLRAGDAQMSRSAVSFISTDSTNYARHMNTQP